VHIIIDNFWKGLLQDLTNFAAKILKALKCLLKSCINYLLVYMGKLCLISPLLFIMANLSEPHTNNKLSVIVHSRQFMINSENLPVIIHYTASLRLNMKKTRLTSSLVSHKDAIVYKEYPSLYM